MLSDVHENVKAQLLRTETTEAIPEDSMFMATDVLGASTREALAAAQMWLANKEVSTDEADERKV
jgi:hypothetical protein